MTNMTLTKLKNNLTWTKANLGKLLRNCQKTKKARKTRKPWKISDRSGILPPVFLTKFIFAKIMLNFFGIIFRKLNFSKTIFLENLANVYLTGAITANILLWRLLYTSKFKIKLFSDNRVINVSVFKVWSQNKVEQCIWRCKPHPINNAAGVWSHRS